MATSGTLGRTQLKTDTVIEHAIRRCKVPPSAQTAETIRIAKDNLYLIMLSLVGRGLNLWCIDQVIISLETGREDYPLPEGSLQVMKALLNRPQLVDQTSTASIANGYQAGIAESTEIIRIGVKFSALTDDSTITVSTGPDGISWTAAQTFEVPNPHSNTVWIELDPWLTSAWFQVETDLASTIGEVFLVSQVASVDLGKWDRDQHAYNQHVGGSGFVTNFYLDLGRPVSLKVWPRPDNDLDHIFVWRHRQIEDVGSLTQELDLPDKWKEAIIWQLALRLAFELPVPDGTMERIAPIAEKTLLEAEAQENDGSGLTFDFMLSSYSRW